jgi:hypothetical protein
MTIRRQVITLIAAVYLGLAMSKPSVWGPRARFEAELVSPRRIARLVFCKSRNEKNRTAMKVKIINVKRMFESMFVSFSRFVHGKRRTQILVPLWPGFFSRFSWDVEPSVNWF